MWLIVVFAFLCCVAVAGTVFVLMNQKPADRDIFLDFKRIKRALGEYHKAHAAKCEDIRLLKKFLGADSEPLLQNYLLMDGERFLVPKNPISKERAAELIERVGGQSRYEEEEKKLYLALLQFKVSEFDPFAVITYFPKENITTTTKIEWKCDESKVEGREILEAEWQNKKERYDEPGLHTVGLRVRDRNSNWSDWTEVQIMVAEEKGVKAIASGAGHFFKLHLSGKIDVYGKNKFGQLGDGTFTDSDTLKRILGFENVAQISAGDSHTLFKHYDGTASACGSNDYGQLGNGTRNHSKTPQKIWGLEQVKQLVAGSDYSLAVLASGGVMSWGHNEFGQLGEDKVPYREMPKRIKDVSRVKQLSASSTHVVACLHDGTVMAWGDNSQGQLGVGIKGRQSEPIVANLAGVFYVAAGKNFTIAVMDNGRVKAVGQNNAGQLGMASESQVLFPKDIPDLKSVVKAVASEAFVVAMTDIGEIYTWGRYSSKEGETYYKPTKVSGLKYVKDIACSSSRGFALMEDGRVAYWSGNLDASEYLEDAHKI